MAEQQTMGPIEAQLRAWGAELDRLKAKVDKEVAEAKKAYYEHLAELREDIEAQVKKWEAAVEGFAPGAEAKKVVRDLRARVEGELREWGPEIEALRARAGRAESEARRLIEELKARRRALKERLGELRGASGAAWEDVRSGMVKAWDELRPALQSAIAKFRS